MQRWALFWLIGPAALICALLAGGAGAQQGPLTLEERTASSLSVAWNWDERPAAAFEVAWRARGEAAAASWRSVRKGPSERRHTISELDAGTHYIVRVRALDTAGLPLSDLRRVFATAESAPLTLELHSSRDLCTAGTLTEVSWTISGGVAPYELTVEGVAVHANAENVRVNCGALTEAEAADAEAALAAKTVSAVVTDSRGVQRQAALKVARARALPPLPPTRDGDSVSAYRREMGFEWHVPATPYSCRKPNCFAIRWRPVGSGEWTYAPLTHYLGGAGSAFGIVRGLADGVVYEAAAAAMRDPIELETPEALRWTAPLSGTTLTNPTGLTATATHDTVTVRWNRQPTARFWSVYLSGPDGGVGEEVFKWDAASWGDSESSVHEVVFRHLPSSTRYKVAVAWDLILENPLETRAETTVETLALPAGSEPLKRGAQNLRATVTHDSITAMWDQPFEESTDFYLVFLSRVDYPYRAARVTPVWHPNTQVTFANLEPNTDYRVDVVHMAIVRPSVEISITTSAQPSSSNEDGAAGASAGQQSGADEWPLSGAFQPVWPHPLRMANGEWSVLDDVEGSRFDRWHGGVDTSLTPLYLELHSSRKLCTAGTLTEVSWTISGGVAPYQISVEGEAVDVDADNIRVNCGALTEAEAGDAEAGDAEAALAAKRITATITDSRGVHRQAAIEVARARALPAPLSAAEYGDSVWAYRGEMRFRWLAPATPYTCRKSSCFAIRWRAAGDVNAAAWTHAPLTLNLSERNLAVGIVRGLSDGVAYEAVAAAMRDPIELETPEALRWTVPLSGTTLTNPTGLTATATYDTVTVRWDRQPTARFWSVQLRGPDGALGRNVQSWDAASWGDPASSVHEVVFRDVPSSTNYEVGVDWNVMEGYEETSAETSVRTLPLPAGREPLLRGPQNLRTASTHNSITVTWDRPFHGDSSDYVVYLFETDYSLLLRLEFVYPPASQITLSDLESETEYQVVVMHNSIVRAQDEVGVMTSAPSVRGANETTATTRASGRSGPIAPSAEPGPLFEWWADGRPTSPPLHMKLRSSRELCTAGTLTEISWQISGGVAPYSLSVEGAAVNADAENVRVNCGALTEAEAGDADAALAAKTVTATVTDSRGVQRQAALEVARARALPAPVGTPSAWPVTADAMAFAWAGARGLEPCDPDALFAVRWRRATASDWHHAFASATGAGNCDVWKAIGDLQEDTAYDAAIAALRHPIELSTPRALRWTRANQARAVTTPSGVTATATHDTVTVRWNRQSTAFGYHVGLSSPNGGASAYLSRNDELAWGDPASGTHEFVFRNLPPDTPFTVSVVIPTPVEHPRRLSAKTQVRTTTLPSGQHPLPRGPQNLRATATADSIAVRWDAPFSGADAEYKVTVYHPRYSSKPLIEWVYRNEFSQGDLESGLTYRVVVEHQGIVRAAAEIEVAITAPTAADPGESPAPPATSMPLIEWWADGRPTSPPLHLELRSSRELCTAGTLTEVSWEISGGVAPYTLSIEGAAVNVDADNVQVNCGALTEAEAGDAEAALDVDRARALPAPTNVRRFSQVGEVIVSWDEVDGAGSQSPTIVHSGRSVTGLVRTRANHDGAPWRYHTATRLYADEWVLGPTSGVQVLSVAAVRHPLEVETPDALSWSDDLVYASTTVAQNVTLAATHDTVTVSWDRQPHVGYQQVWVWLSRADNEGGRRWKTLHEELGVAGRHTMTFNGLPADTQLEVVIEMHDSAAAERPDLPSNVTQHTVRTLLAPPGWTPAPVGPQNLRYMQTSGVTTVLWDEPYPDAEPSWFLTIENLATGAIWGTWVSGTAWTLPADLVVLPDTVYLVTVEHADLVSGAASISFRTPPTPPAGQAESLAPPARPMPLFEWWADGRPTSPPLDLKLESSRELCTAGTLTEVSWEISGGVAPYQLSIEGEAVDVDADNIRINCGPLPTESPHRRAARSPTEDIPRLRQRQPRRQRRRLGGGDADHAALPGRRHGSALRDLRLDGRGCDVGQLRLPRRRRGGRRCNLRKPARRLCYPAADPQNRRAGNIAGDALRRRCGGRPVRVASVLRLLGALPGDGGPARPAGRRAAQAARRGADELRLQRLHRRDRRGGRGPARLGGAARSGRSDPRRAAAPRPLPDRSRRLGGAG